MKRLTSRHSQFFIITILSFLLPALAKSQLTLRSYKDTKIGKFGYKNKDGQVIIPAKYDRVYGFIDGLCIVSLDKKYGFIDETGKEITPIKYEGTENFREERARVQLDKKWGFIDKTGKEIVSPVYQGADFFNEGLARVKLEDKWGFIDRSGKVIIPLTYQAAGNFNEGLARFITDNKYGYMDKTGKQVIPNIYQNADSISESAARVMLNNRWGFIDKTGKQIVENKYEDAGNFKKGVAWVQLNNKFGYINKTGIEITPIKYDQLYFFVDDVTRVVQNKKYGLINIKGQELVEPKYDSIGVFYTGFAMAKLNNKWGYLNFSGKEIIPVKYDVVEEFFLGTSRVKLDNKYGFYDTTGKEIVPVKYQYLGKYLSFGSEVKLNNKWGLLDSTGKEVVPCIYDKFSTFEFEDGDEFGFYNGQAMVMLNGKWGVIDKKGKEIIPIKYELVQNYNNYDEPNEYTARLNNEWFLIDATGKILQSKPVSSSVKKDAPVNAPDVKLLDPPLPMKGSFDPTMVGTWKARSPELGYTGYFIFRANGTYDYWSETPGSKPPEATNSSFWRIDGDVLEIVHKARNTSHHLKMLKRNDPQNNKPALMIEWTLGAEDYRTYYPVESKELWKTNNANVSSKTKNTENKPTVAINVIEPPVKLNGIVDQSMAGVWKFSFNEVDYYLEFKADGTYDRWTSKDTRKLKCYWRIDNNFFESFCGNEKGRVAFQKFNDLLKGQPYFQIDQTVYWPLTDKEMWK